MGLKHLLARMFYGMRPRSGRLSSSIEVYRQEVERRQPEPSAANGWLNRAKHLIEHARRACDAGRLDEGWKSLHAAQRDEIFGLSAAERQQRAAALCFEVEQKLKGSWRAEAIVKALAPPAADPPPSHEAVPPSAECLVFATALRDEAADTQYFRMAYLRNLLVLLLLVMTVALGLVFRIGEPYWFGAQVESLVTARFPDGPPPPHGEQGHASPAPVETAPGRHPTGALAPRGAPRQHGADTRTGGATAAPAPASKNFLYGLALFGLIGGAFSAMRDLSMGSTRKRIPQQIADSYVTLMRPFMGAAAALVVFLFLQSGLLSLGTLSPPLMLAVAFTSGWSERLVVRGVDALSGK